MDLRLVTLFYQVRQLINRLDLKKKSFSETNRWLKFLYYVWKLAERRVVSLRKRVEELRSELEAANAELEGSKRLKETTEQDLKGYEVELAMNIATIHTLEVYLYYCVTYGRIRFQYK